MYGQMVCCEGACGTGGCYAHWIADRSVPRGISQYLHWQGPSSSSSRQNAKMTDPNFVVRILTRRILKCRFSSGYRRLSGSQLLLQF